MSEPREATQEWARERIRKVPEWEEAEVKCVWWAAGYDHHYASAETAKGRTLGEWISVCMKDGDRALRALVAAVESTVHG